MSVVRNNLKLEIVNRKPDVTKDREIVESLRKTKKERARCGLVR